MNASSVEVTGASGIRVGVVHVTPSVDVDSTMSFSSHPVRKRQSCHTA